MTRWRHLLAISAATVLVVAACGDDDDDTTSGTEAGTDAGTAVTTEAPGTTAPETDTSPAATDGETAVGDLTVTVTDDGIEGLPGEMPNGAVTVTLQNDASGSTALDFVRVSEDATEDDVRAALADAFAGGPIADVLEAISGVTDTASGASTTNSFEVEPGRHFVVAVPAPEEEDGGEGAETESTAETTDTTTAGDTDTTSAGDTDTTSAGGTDTTAAAEEDGAQGPPPEAFLLEELTVTEEASGAELPETDGTFTAVDYSFEVDVEAGGTYTVRNDGPNEIHHAVLVGFGSADPAAVEENLLPFLESEGDEPPPEGIDPAEIDFELGGSSVFSPGLGGTFDATLDTGTYAVLCFIQDRAGGPPHAIAYEMFEVFTVE